MAMVTNAWMEQPTQSQSELREAKIRGRVAVVMATSVGVGLCLGLGVFLSTPQSGPPYITAVVNSSMGMPLHNGGL